MRHGLRLHGSPHDHSDDHAGKLVTNARQYEVVANLLFLGRRRQVFDDLVSASGAKPGDRVLDVGCGTGYFTRRAALAVMPDGRATGIDPSQPVIDHAARTALQNCTFEVAGAQDLPFPNGSFDVVVSSLAVHHLPEEDRATAMREAFRVLKPGGRLLIAEFRLPRSRFGQWLVGVITDRSMAHNPVESLAALIEGPGFELTGQDDRLPWLYYIQARRPAAAA